MFQGYCATPFSVLNLASADDAVGIWCHIVGDRRPLTIVCPGPSRLRGGHALNRRCAEERLRRVPSSRQGSWVLSACTTRTASDWGWRTPTFVAPMFPPSYCATSVLPHNTRGHMPCCFDSRRSASALSTMHHDASRVVAHAWSALASARGQGAAACWPRMICASPRATEGSAYGVVPAPRMAGRLINVLRCVARDCAGARAHARRCIGGRRPCGSQGQEDVG